MKEYKVWVYVELVDEEEDLYEDILEIPILAGTFDSRKQALEFANNLPVTIPPTSFRDVWTVEDWRLDVQEGHTSLGYEDWLVHMWESCESKDTFLCQEPSDPKHRWVDAVVLKILDASAICSIKHPEHGIVDDFEIKVPLSMFPTRPHYGMPIRIELDEEDRPVVLARSLK